MITKSYIKMCEEAKEIQRAWKPIDWDRFIYKDDRESGIACVDERHETAKLISYRLEHYIWLPTQEQLQEMVKDRWFHIWGYKSNDFYMTASTGNRDSHYVCEKIKSMNELWLIFVMKERYDKIWDGKKWK